MKGAGWQRSGMPLQRCRSRTGVAPEAMWGDLRPARRMGRPADPQEILNDQGFVRAHWARSMVNLPKAMPMSMPRPVPERARETLPLVMACASTDLPAPACAWDWA